MKIVAKKSTDIPLTLNITVLTDHLIFHDDMLIELLQQGLIVASDIELPQGPVIDRKKARVTGSMEDDFESFVERIEDFCELKMKLIGTYKNASADNSYYYNYLAKDSEGNIIVRIRLKLRISNHPAKRGSRQSYNKDQELASKKLHELLTQEQIDNLDTYPLIILVNSDKFDSYEDAYNYIAGKIQRAVEVMQTRK